MTRERLPHRRGAEHFGFKHDGIDYVAGFARFPDGRLAEVFLNAGKLDTQADILARDSAIAASLALQAGCTADELRAALTRTVPGAPAGPLAVALDKIAEAFTPEPVEPRVPRFGSAEAADPARPASSYPHP